MKKLIFLFLSVIFTFFYSGNVIAQTRPNVEIASVKHNGKNVDFTLTSSKPFIFGNNRYILYIGNKEFLLNKQSHPNGKGIITFFIPAADFSSLTEGSDIYLTYGRIFSENDQNKEAKAKLNRHCWTLGKFNKTLLSK